MKPKSHSAKRPSSRAQMPTAQLRRQELIGLDEEGNMSLWDTGDVLPVQAFEADGPWIKSGHYVIDWKGTRSRFTVGAHAMV